MNHQEVDIAPIVAQFETIIEKTLNIKPRFKTEGGAWQEDIARQNVQARTRMVMSYLISQLLPLSEKREGFLVVLATGNLDESLTGYFTKYDNSSGDLNLIGSLNKNDIRNCMKFLIERYGDVRILQEILDAKPSAELKPVVEGQEAQNDEKELGMTFDELNEMNELRMVDKCGIVSIFERFVDRYPEKDLDELHALIKNFYKK